MTNENKKINELVSDDDPTSELEAATFRQGSGPGVALLESDDGTFNLEEDKTFNLVESEERADNEPRTIGKLQYDNEQLRARWIGVKTELRAREEITERLNAELTHLKDELARKDMLIRERDDIVESLKAEMRDRDLHHHDVTTDLRRHLN